jgi:hypothetical protein
MKKFMTSRNDFRQEDFRTMFIGRFFVTALAGCTLSKPNFMKFHEIFYETQVDEIS